MLSLQIIVHRREILCLCTLVILSQTVGYVRQACIRPITAHIITDSTRVIDFRYVIIVPIHTIVRL